MEDLNVWLTRVLGRGVLGFSAERSCNFGKLGLTAEGSLISGPVGPAESEGQRLELIPDRLNN